MQSLPTTIALNDYDFRKEVYQFTPPPSSKYTLPRIAFIGYFKYLSMTSQREICEHLNFEFFPEIEMATVDQKKLQILTTKWNDITKTFTKLIILGHDYKKMPEWHFNYLFFKKYKNDHHPAVIEYNIPVMMENELWKLYDGYPEISNNLSWKSSNLLPPPMPFGPIDIQMDLF